MSRDPRYDILFEPVKIGPVTARNRFYQVPHCNGMGRVHPSSMAAMRGMKAAGGWAVVCTEEVEIHPSADHTPWSGGRLWDDRDVPVHARMCEAIHAHDSLVGIELNHAGLMSGNRYSRLPLLAPSALPNIGHDPVQARAMDKSDIAELRRWHREAALRAREAGYDIVYVYIAHQLSTMSHFLSPYRNRRTDEYGGSLENRARLFREILADTKDAVGDTMGVAVRFAVDELMGDAGFTSEAEGRELIEMVAEEPDLWDVNISGWEHDSATSRFKASGFQDEYVDFVKQVTTKPVVGVGRYTSPDAMVSLIKGGKLDFIGAARPSIADPFLPKKIEEGRIEEIRECIGCNICVASDQTFAPLRCTQNPTMGEEWRRGWHPDRMNPKTSEDTVLVIGGGPAGLECTRALGERGYTVTLAEAVDELGGRLRHERKLPGLAEWGRVVDHRTYMISQMANVHSYLESPLEAAQIRDFGADHVVVATGAKWCREGIGRENPGGISLGDGAKVLTPDDIFRGAAAEGPVVLFDDDHYYMGGVLAEKLRGEGHEVTLVTPASTVSAWTVQTLEQHVIQSRLMEMGVRLLTCHNLEAVSQGKATLSCIYTDAEREIECGTAVLVTMRHSHDALYRDLSQTKIASLSRIGDALVPGTIAAAVHSGHLFARELNEPARGNVPFEREIVALSDQFEPGG